MSTEKETKVPERASMRKVVMKKDALLKKLVENKAKHDVVLEAATQGYWKLAHVKLQEKQKNLYEQLADYKKDAARQFRKVKQKISDKQVLPNRLTIAAISFDTNLGLTMPEDHTKDYDRAIAMMESTVYDEVELTVQEFDAYVLNEWEWKNNFIASNSLYYNSLSRSDMEFSISGCAIPVGYSANSLTGCYVTAKNAIYSGLVAGSGISL